MNYYITTDPHLGHTNMQTLCNRPLNFSEMIIENHRKILKSDDILICLGDVALCSSTDYPIWNDKLTLIPCLKKWLVRGNHDKRSDSWYLSHGWDFISEAIILNRFGTRVLFSHKPVGIMDDIELTIHGHLHNSVSKDNYTPKHYHLALEYTDYKPVSLQDILKEYKKRNKIKFIPKDYF